MTAISSTRPGCPDYPDELNSWLVHRLGAEHERLTHGLDMAQEATREQLREQWRALLAPPRLHGAGEPRLSPVPEVHPLAQHISLPLFEDVDMDLPAGAPRRGSEERADDPGLTAAGFLAVPDQPRGLVVAVHGLGGGAERVFDRGNRAYRGFAAHLVDAGFAVLAPSQVAGIPNRNRVQDLARLNGTSVEGIELARVGALLDALPRVEGISRELTSTVGLWGISWGGLAGLWWAPLDRRIAVVVSCAYATDRVRKMTVTDDPSFLSFQEAGEHHAFLAGQLGPFSDAELAALVIPRPLQVQHGRTDAVAPVADVEREARRMRAYYETCDRGERFEFLLHDNGHGTDMEEGLRFLEAWLRP